MDAGEVADLLEEVHFDEGLGLDHGVGPEEIPVSLLPAVLYPPVEGFGHVAHHIVLGHCVRHRLLLTLITICLCFAFILEPESSTGILLLLFFPSATDSSDDYSLDIINLYVYILCAISPPTWPS